MQTRPPRRRLVMLAAVLLAPALLAACAEDPFERPGTWHAAADNDHNLRLMVADPGDLEHGRGTEVSRGAASAGAIGRLRSDKLKSLPGSTESFVVGGASGATAQP